MSDALVTATVAGVDNWSPSWYVDPDGRCARVLRQLATVRTKRGGMMLPDAIHGHRVGWFPGGLVFADGHPDPEGLCKPSELGARALGLQDALIARGIPLVARQRGFRHSGATSEGWAGLRYVHSTVNMEAKSKAAGVATLAGIAACTRDSPGHAEVRYGLDHGVETVYLRGYAGKRVLGRWYDKGLESSKAARGRLIRAEDQRLWGKEERRDPEELDASTLRGMFTKRFYPLYQATQGVTVAGPVVLAERLIEAVAAKHISPRQAEMLAGHMLLRVAGSRRGAGIPRTTMYRREQELRRLSLVLADGVLSDSDLDEVSVDVGAVLEAALDTGVWGCDG
jgi:hypothetical protein